MKKDFQQINKEALKNLNCKETKDTRKVQGIKNRDMTPRANS